MNHNEYIEQVKIFNWALLAQGRYPELKLLYHVENEGKRTVQQAVRAKKGGLKAGVPDICLPVSRKGFHGLYIELKSEKGRISPLQNKWLAELNKQGYKAVVEWGAENSIKEIENYLKGQKMTADEEMRKAYGKKTESKCCDCKHRDGYACGKFKESEKALKEKTK